MQPSQSLEPNAVQQKPGQPHPFPASKLLGWAVFMAALGWCAYDLTPFLRAEARRREFHKIATVGRAKDLVEAELQANGFHKYLSQEAYELMPRKSKLLDVVFQMARISSQGRVTRWIIDNEDILTIEYAANNTVTKISKL